MAETPDRRATEGKRDYAAELKALRRRRADLAEESDKLEQRLAETKARATAAHESERAKKSVESERKSLEAEEKRVRELSEQLKGAVPQQLVAHAPEKKDAADARIVELGRSKEEKADAAPFHGFVIVRRFFGVDEFAKVEKREKGVVSKTKKLVGM